MLTREDLLVWSETDFTPPEELRRASPALALACLEALKIFRWQMADGDRGERASLEPVTDELERALAAAGVEVRDGE